MQVILFHEDDRLPYTLGNQPAGDAIIDAHAITAESRSGSAGTMLSQESGWTRLVWMASCPIMR